MFQEGSHLQGPLVRVANVLHDLSGFFPCRNLQERIEGKVLDWDVPDSLVTAGHALRFSSELVQWMVQ
jgi:hypothetical protein